MFAEKKVKIFDTSKLKPGYLITLAAMGYDTTEGYYEIYHINGIIHYVDERYFTYINSDGNKKRVDISQVFDKKNPDMCQKYSINGIYHKLKGVSYE